VNNPEKFPMTVADMETLVSEHRRLLENLEATLAARRSLDVNEGTQTEEAAPRVSARETRIARNEVRRAARRAVRRGSEGLAMPRLPEGREYLQDISGARIAVWERTSEAMRAIEAGDLARSRTALDEILAIEAVSENAVDDVTVPPAWRSVQRELLNASDDLIDYVREASIVLNSEGEDMDAALRSLSSALGAQSQWLRAWRGFIQIAPERVA
jgi:hypothetical protein